MSSQAVLLFTTSQFRTFRKIIASQTGRNAQMIFAGQAVSGAFGFVINLLLIRELTTPDFGSFCLFTSTYMLLGGIFQLAWNDTYVRFGARYLGHAWFKVLEGFIFRRLLLGSLFLALASAAFAPLITHHFYHDSRSAGFLIQAILVGLVSSWNAFYLGKLRISSHYFTFFCVNVGAQILRLLALSYFLFTHTLTLQLTMTSYLLVPILVLAYNLYPLKMAKKTESSTAHLDPVLRGEMTHYHSWLLLNVITYTLTGNLDSQILAHFHADRSLATIGVGGRLLLPFQFVITAICTALLTKASVMDPERSNVLANVRRTLWAIAPPATVMLLITAAVAPLLLKLTGPQYSDMMPLLRIQLITLFVAVFWQPLAVILQGLGRARELAVLGAVQLITQISLNWIWIPRYAAMGAASTSLIVNCLAFFWVIGIFIRKAKIA